METMWYLCNYLWKINILWVSLIYALEASYLLISLFSLYPVAIEIIKIQFLWKLLLLIGFHQSVYMKNKLNVSECPTGSHQDIRQVDDSVNNLQWPYVLCLSKRKMLLLHFACICLGEIWPEKQHTSTHKILLVCQDTRST